MSFPRKPYSATDKPGALLASAESPTGTVLVCADGLVRPFPGDEMTLHEALAAIGWSSGVDGDKPRYAKIYSREIFNAKGESLGWHDARDTWHLLREHARKIGGAQ